MRLPLVAACFVLVGCQADGLGAPFDPTQPIAAPTGIYTLDVESVSDSCTPSFPSGDVGPAVVSIGERGMSVPIPSPGGTVDRQHLTAPDGYAIVVDPKLPCGTQLHREVQLIAADERSLEVSLRESWTDVALCRGSWIAFLTDCAADRIIHYTLKKTCPQPLRTIMGPGTLDCL